MDLKVILVLFFACSDAYKILLTSHMPLRSLNILGVGYVRHLLNAGHEVTYITTVPMKNPPEKNYRQIDLSSHFNIYAGDKLFDVGYLMEHPISEDADILYWQDMGRTLIFATFEHEEVKKLLADPRERFDVVISDFFESEVQAALAAYYECPMIWAYSLGAHWTTVQLVDEPTSAATAMDYLTPDIPPFHQISTRVKKLWMRWKWQFNKWYKTKPMEKAFYEEYFGPLFSKKNKPLPDYDSVIFNASLVLANDFVGNGPTPSLPQNYKFIGGYHIETPPKPLSGEIKTIVDNAEHGFIFFSMGSIFQAKDIPEHVKKALLDVFAGLKETVLWKFEEDLPNTPKNVHIVKWAPQQSILAHPKLKLFITHGGLLSTLESAHFGVPTIGVPIFFDQFINVYRAVEAGRTIKVDLSLNIANDLKVAINKILQDPTYKENAMKQSLIFQDRPVPPGKELVHWVEHVVKTRGAVHLRSPASLMPWWEKLYLDVVVLSIALVLIAQYLIKKYLFQKNVCLKNIKKNN